MDRGTVVGFVMGLGIIAAAIAMHGSLREFIDVAGAMVAFGGSTAALFIMFPSQKVLGVFGVVKHCFLNRLPEPREAIRRLTDLAGLAKKHGPLALEGRLPDIHDPFLVHGLELVIDGTPKDKLEEVLTIDLECIEGRHESGKKIFEFLGASLPGFAMVGTLIGLIQMLGRLEEPSRIGAGMAVAMCTTFYGALAANLVFLPLAGKLEARSREEILLRELMIRGLVGIAAGESPRAIETRLKAFLAPAARRLAAEDEG